MAAPRLKSAPTSPARPRRRRTANPEDVDLAIARAKESLGRQGTPARATHEKRYLKSDLSFLGATQPVVRREAKALARAHPDFDRKALRALAERAWHSDVHELRSLAIGVLELRTDVLAPTDVAWLIALVRRANTWAHVDWLAIKVVGPLVARAPKLAATLARWATHENLWVRRTALLALHDPLFAGGGDFTLFTRLAVPMLGEREFFIRKAIGWMLRATARRAPERTVRFVENHAAAMAGLTFKEATRALSPRQQQRLGALRAGAAPLPRAQVRN